MSIRELSQMFSAFNAAQERNRGIEMSNPTELPDLDRIQPSHYSNGPGNVPRLPDRVVDTLIDSAGVSRCAPGRTDITVRDQTAEVERLVHDVCEELLARLPGNSRAQPEGEAPQAESIDTPEFCDLITELQAAHEEVNRDNSKKAWAALVRHIDARIAAPAATLSPLCGAQHAESGKESVRQHEAIEVAVDQCYPKQDSPHASVNDRIGAARMAFRKGYHAALAAQQAAAPQKDTP